MAEWLIVVGRERRPAQDLEFSARVLVKGALRAVASGTGSIGLGLSGVAGFGVSC